MALKDTIKIRWMHRIEVLCDITNKIVEADAAGKRNLKYNMESSDIQRLRYINCALKTYGYEISIDFIYGSDSTNQKMVLNISWPEDAKEMHKTFHDDAEAARKIWGKR